MDFSRRRTKTVDDEVTIASMLHATILNELFRSLKWQRRDAVFHGGTSLRFLRGSPRQSEDLDFMITQEAAQALATAMVRVHDRVRSRMRLLTPGCEVELKGPKGKAVEAWYFTWSHPNVIGSVKVKTEFLVTTLEHLAAYQSTHLMPTTGGMLSVTGYLPGPTLVSAWSDKVVALAMRQALKWRDVFDLDFITNAARMDRQITWESKFEALAATAAIYGYSSEDVLEGLERLVESGQLEDCASFERDMSRFFDPSTYQEYLDSDVFRSALDGTRAEVLNIMDVYKEEMEVGPRP